MENDGIFSPLIGKEAGEQLEYKPTLIPAFAIAQIVAGFANTNGGSLIFGVREKPKRPPEVQGISSDFHIRGMVIKALDLIEPKPDIYYSYFNHAGIQLFGIKVEKSIKPILVAGQLYKRDGKTTINQHEKELPQKLVKFPRFGTLKKDLENEKLLATTAKGRLIDHYLNILRLYEPTLDNLFPPVITDTANVPEGKILNRILFTSCVDNFETYLSELLYEIYLARPETLKGGDSTVRVAEVLDCGDIDEFIQRFAAKRVSKLQKGSIKGFLKDNLEISSLNALSENEVSDIEKILQIRHLYSHRNGIVDESFLAHFRGQYSLNTEHQLSISEVLDKLEYIIEVVKKIDQKAMQKYSLSTQAP